MIHSIACYMLWILNLKQILQLVQNLVVCKVTLDYSCMLGQGTVNKAIENKGTEELLAQEKTLII